MLLLIGHVFVLCILVVSDADDIYGDVDDTDVMDPLVCNQVSYDVVYDIDELMGLWHTVEIIQHRDEQRFRGVQTTDTCPMVHLAKTGSSDLKMLWHEPAGYVEYRFRITDISNPGFWLSWGPQNGSMLTKPYTQFAGTVQVMKAVQTHMVLTFCSPNQSHYSIILARFNHLSSTEIRGVRNLLGRRGLPQTGVRETCKDSAPLAGPTTVLVLLSALTLVFSRSN
ncbi:uncharacterized protein LOC124359927 isoform X1 [Homalodisca vitripennis]|uniref:uncharacterized protein LOC124359927 isoform X1 n=1 Tax=Homalodisca vitripennis TaxID=197043 RepID=UPI001EEB600A|nr:uncharacterized protein LOC124359927 isoform X1 [Homalodisca vitripennis]